MEHEDKIKKFIGHVAFECINSNVEFKIYPTNKTKCEGFFQRVINQEKAQLVVKASLNLDDWLSVLVHEYCHFLQFMEDTYQEHEPWNVLESWLDGKNYPHEDIKTAISYIKSTELDCERKSLKVISKFKLPIDRKLYIKQAASHIHYYNYLLDSRQRTNTKVPEEFPEIMVEMPSSLSGNFVKISKRVLNLYYKHLGGIYGKGSK